MGWGSGYPRPHPRSRRPGGAQRGQSASATVVSAAPAPGPTVSLSPVRGIPRSSAIRLGTLSLPTAGSLSLLGPCASRCLASFPTRDTRPRLSRKGSMAQLVDPRAFSGVAEPQRCGGGMALAPSPTTSLGPVVSVRGDFRRVSPTCWLSLSTGVQTAWVEIGFGQRIWGRCSGRWGSEEAHRPGLTGNWYKGEKALWWNFFIFLLLTQPLGLTDSS